MARLRSSSFPMGSMGNSFTSCETKAKPRYSVITSLDSAARLSQKNPTPGILHSAFVSFVSPLATASFWHPSSAYKQLLHHRYTEKRARLQCEHGLKRSTGSSTVVHFFGVGCGRFSRSRGKYLKERSSGSRGIEFRGSS